MSEIEKLRMRLKNVGKNVTQYNMTVAEARALVKEIGIIEKKLLEKPKEVYIRVPVPGTNNHGIDGGTF